MRPGRLLLAGMVLLMLATGAVAGGSVSIRLVQASNQSSGIGAGLQDVGPALGSLSFSGYSLVGSSSAPVPSPGTTTRVGPYLIQCNGPQSAFKIQVYQGGRRLLRTTVNLRAGKPLILGGFPSGNGKMILVFLVR